MRTKLKSVFACAVLAWLALPGIGCSGRAGHAPRVKLGPIERFDWVRQPIEFSPPPANWYRDPQGVAGVRFILTNGGGQCISLESFRQWTTRLPREEIAKLLETLDTSDQRGTLDKLARLRVQLTDPLNDGETRAANDLNRAVDAAESDLLAERFSFVKGDLEQALRAVDGFKPTLPELLPRMRLPQRQQDPEHWVLGSGRDTVIAGLEAYVGDDTLYAPEQKLLYQQVFWVVDGLAFQAVFQGKPENQYVFEQVLETVHFPQAPQRAGL